MVSTGDTKITTTEEFSRDGNLMAFFERFY